MCHRRTASPLVSIFYPVFEAVAEEESLELIDPVVEVEPLPLFVPVEEYGSEVSDNFQDLSDLESVPVNWVDELCGKVLCFLFIVFVLFVAL